MAHSRRSRLPARSRSVTGIPLSLALIALLLGLQLSAALDSGTAPATEPQDTGHAPMTVSGLSEDELAALTESWGRGR